MEQPPDLCLVIGPNSERTSMCRDETADMMSIADSPKGMDNRLYTAARSGNVELLKDLHNQKLNFVREETPKGDTALHQAAYYGRHDFVVELLKFSSEDLESGRQFVKAKNTEGNTALHEAAMGGHDEILETLLKQDGDLACMTNGAGETALFKAAEEGHTKIVKRLLGCTPSEHDRRSSDGQTPLHRAVLKVHTGVVKELINERPGLLKQGDNNYQTPLHMAAFITTATPPPLENFRPCWLRKYFQDIPQIVNMLLKKDDSICYRVDINGQSPLHVAAKEGKVVLVQQILNCRNDCLQMVDKDGRNALHLAVENASQIFVWDGTDLKTIISSLILKKLINCTDKTGRTALDIAIENEDKDPQLFMGIARYLQKNGAIKSKFEAKAKDTSPTSTWKSEILSVNAVLIATVAFAVAFTLPGGIASDGENRQTPALINLSGFKAFVIFDTLALCYSIASAVLLLFANANSHVEDPVIAGFSMYALWVAMVSLVLTFGAAIHLVVAHRCLWLAVVVWVMVCSLPIIILVYSRFGKLHLFNDRKGRLHSHIVSPLLLVSFGLLFPVYVFVGVLLVCGIILPIYYRIRKKPNQE